MSNRNNRNVSKGNNVVRAITKDGRIGRVVSKDVPVKGRTDAGKGKGKGKGSKDKGIVVNVKSLPFATKDVAEQIRDLRSQLDDADRETQKGIRRRLRSLGYWGGKRTRTNWIARVPDAKRKDVVNVKGL